MTMTFPVSRFVEFENKFRNGDYRPLRYGQAFHAFMDLHKIVSEKEFCDKLYNTDGLTAKRMVESRLDYNHQEEME